MASKVFQTAIELSASLAPSFSPSMTQGSKALAKLGTQAAKLTRSSESIKTYQRLETQVDKSAKTLDGARAEMGRLEAQAKKAGTPSKELTEQIKVQAQVVKRAERELTKQQNRLNRAGDALRTAGLDTKSLTKEQQKLATQLARTQARMSLGGAVGALGKSVQKAGKEFVGLSKAVAATGAAAAASVFALAKTTADYGDNVAKTAAALGLSIEGLQEYRYVAQQSGLSTQELDNSFRYLSINIGKAARDGGALAKPFKQLGLNARQLQKLSPEDQMMMIADRMGRLKTQAERATVAQTLFGRAGLKLLPMLKGGAAGIDELRKQGRALGFVMSEETARSAEVFQDRLLDAQMALTGVKNVLGAELMPVVHDVMVKSIALVTENKDAIGEMAKTAGEWITNTMVPAIQDIAVWVKTTGARVIELTTRVADMVGGWDNFAKIAGALVASKFIVSLVGVGVSVVKVAVAVGQLTAASKLAAAAQWAWNLAMNANPIGLIIAGVAALAGGAYLLIKNWNKVKEFFWGLYGVIKKALGPVGKLLPGSDAKDGPLAGLTKADGAILSTMGEGVKADGAILSTMGEGVKTGGSDSLVAPVSAGVAPVVAPPFFGGGGGETVINLTYAPVINGQGEGVGEALRMNLDELKRMLLEVQQQQRRVSYG